LKKKKQPLLMKAWLLYLPGAVMISALKMKIVPIVKKTAAVHQA